MILDVVALVIQIFLFKKKKTGSMLIHRFFSFFNNKKDPPV